MCFQQTSLFDTVDANAVGESTSIDTKDDVLIRPPQKIVLRDGALLYFPRWLQQQTLPTTATSLELFEQLKQDVQWEQSTIMMYGKRLKIPRLNAWYGDKGCGYRYSSRYFEPLPWLPQLQHIKLAIEQAIKNELTEAEMARHSFDVNAQVFNRQIFNSALVNCYRNGQDSVAWHSDDEPELGKNPIVASLSLGQERMFQLRHRQHRTEEKYQLLLADGDLVIMHGTTQHYWHHQIPKTTHNIAERINITFRTIYPI